MHIFELYLIAMETETDMLRRHANERAELQIEFEKKKSDIPKKDRPGRARLAEDHSNKGRAMQARHATELETADKSEATPPDEVGVVTARLEDLTAIGNGTESKGARRRRKKAAKKKAANSLLATEDNDAGDDETATSQPVADSSATNETEQSSQVQPTQKLSRAARRRLKRAQEEQASEQRVLDERASMGPSERDVEMTKLRTQLAGLNLRVHTIAADGNCMYNAVLHQLNQIPEADGDVAIEVNSVNELRSATADYMLKHVSDFLPFVDDGVDGDREKYAAYCEKLRSENVWGGQVELRAVAELLNVRINVYAVDLPLVTMGSSGHLLQVSFHRKFFGLGEHYNSLVPVS